MDAKIDAILHYIGDWIDDHFGQYVEDSTDDLTNMIKKIGECERMQIVIDIPEDVYKQCILANSLFEVQLVNYIANGTPLPPHGDLIDRDALIARGCYWETEYEMSKAPTILEATKGEDNNGKVDI